MEELKLQIITLEHRVSELEKQNNLLAQLITDLTNKSNNIMTKPKAYQVVNGKVIELESD